jgi:ABC-2 type transport system ATP-binding protein
MSIVYTTHYMEEAERLCDRIAIVDRGRIVALGSKEDLVHQAFASRSRVLARFGGAADGIAAWVRRLGGTYVDSTAQFTVEHPTEIVGLLQAAAQDGLELIDVSLSKPNLESVFLHLTGRELRD